MVYWLLDHVFRYAPRWTFTLHSEWQSTRAPYHPFFVVSYVDVMNFINYYLFMILSRSVLAPTLSDTLCTLPTFPTMSDHNPTSDIAEILRSPGPYCGAHGYHSQAGLRL